MMKSEQSTYTFTHTIHTPGRWKEKGKEGHECRLEKERRTGKMDGMKERKTKALIRRMK